MTESKESAHLYVASQRAQEPAPSGAGEISHEGAVMAIFHLAAKVISRGKGQSAIAAAAYRSGERLVDEETGEVKEYRARSERILFAGIFAPKDAPSWAHDRNELWNEVEQFERRKDAQLAREIEVALPHELTDEQRLWLVKDFVRENFTRQGYAVDAAIHTPDRDADARNYHAHLMITMRTVDADGFAPTKDRSLNTPEQLKEWREDWAHLCNRHLERHGHEAQIDHRSLEAQGLEREPTKHNGYKVEALAARGQETDRYVENQEIRIANGERALPHAAREQLARAERVEQPTSSQPFENARATTLDDAELGRHAGHVAGGEWIERAGMAAQQGAALEETERAPKRAALDAVADGGLNMIGKFAEAVGDLFGGGGPPLTPQQHERIAQRESDAAEARHTQQLEARQATALERANTDQAAKADEKSIKDEELAQWIMARGRERGRNDDGGRER